MPSSDIPFPSAAPSESNSGTAQHLFAEALEHLDQHDWETAGALLDRLPFEALGEAEVLSARALALQLALNQARYDDALVHADAALDLTEAEPLIYSLTGLALWATGDIRTGAEALVRAAELLQATDPATAPFQLPADPAAIYFLAGEACQHYEQYEAALAFFQQAGLHAPMHEAIENAVGAMQALLKAPNQAA